MTAPEKPPRQGGGVHGSLLPKGASVGWFAGAGLVNAIGTGFFYPFSLLFFHSVYGLPFAAVGAGLTATMLAVLPAVTWVGRLADRAGPRAVLIAASLLRAAAFVGFVTVPGPASFLAFNTVVAICNRAEHAATPVLATALAPAGDSGPWLALSRTVLNAGIGIGALLGGLVLGAERHGFIVLALANAASFLGAAMLYLPLPEVRPPVRDTGTRRGKPWRHRAFLHLVAVNTVLWLVALAVEIGMPTYLVARLGAPAFAASPLFAVNTILLTLLQLPVAGHLARLNAWHVMGGGAVLRTVLLGVLAAASHVGPSLRLGLLVGGMVVYTLGELMISQARLLLLTGISPPAQRGTFLAFNQVFMAPRPRWRPALSRSSWTTGRRCCGRPWRRLHSSPPPRRPGIRYRNRHRPPRRRTTAQPWTARPWTVRTLPRLIGAPGNHHSGQWPDFRTAPRWHGLTIHGPGWRRAFGAAGGGGRCTDPLSGPAERLAFGNARASGIAGAGPAGAVPGWLNTTNPSSAHCSPVRCNPSPGRAPASAASRSA